MILSAGYQHRAPENWETTVFKVDNIKIGDARKHFLFQKARAWLDSAVHGGRRSTPFISTEGSGPNKIIKMQVCHAMCYFYCRACELQIKRCSTYKKENVLNP